jgi:hypothetical protein
VAVAGSGNPGSTARISKGERMQPIIGEDLDEQIRRRAYEIWEESGRPEGMESQHWEQAAREIAASAVDQPSSGAAGTPERPQAAQRAAKAVGARQGSRRSAAKPD